jgi:polysaccharide chain length determinant protein (PEP-CTERM system associated)
MEDMQVHALDYASVLGRRKWWLTVPIVASILIGLALVRWLPKEYTSTTTLGVVAPMVSPSLVNQSTPLDNQERLRAMSQQLTSVPILARVAKEEGLGSGSPTDPEVGRLRAAISVAVPDPVAITSEPRRFDTFLVSYADADPARAQRVSNRLASVFVDESSRTREEHAEDTSVFIATQLRAAQARLADLEGQLRTSKEAYMGRLPEQTQANLQTLNGLRQQLDSNAITLRGEQDRLTVLEQQMDAVKQGRGGSVIIPRGNGADDVATPETRVLSLQRELATARSIYTDKHPEVQRLQEELATARRDAASDLAKPEADRVAQLQLDPAYRQLSAEREASRLRVRELQRANADTQKQIGLYQQRVEAAPMVEQQLAGVQRDYDLAKQQYDDLSSKLHSAMIAESVERNRSGEQFTVLYPASFPSEPTKPVPLRVMLVSILAGVCLGAALALGREYLDRSVHDVRDLKDDFDVPILGEVARIQHV